MHLRERCKSVENVSAMLFPTNGMVNAKYMGNDMYDVNLFGVEEGYATRQRAGGYPRGAFLHR